MGESIARLYNKDMKKLLAAMFVALLMVGCANPNNSGSDNPESNQSSAETPPAKSPEVAKVVVDGDQLEGRGGRAYFEEKPFTGVAVWKHENGQKRQEQNWKDGELDGLATRWHENGQKKDEYTYKDGKVVSMKEWDEDGIGRVVWERTKPPTTNTK